MLPIGRKHCAVCSLNHESTVAGNQKKTWNNAVNYFRTLFFPVFHNCSESQRNYLIHNVHFAYLGVATLKTGHRPEIS